MGRVFRGLRQGPERTYDVVVIGAGIGGLICANLLARHQLRVLLIEQVGGYCSMFRRKGYLFDAGTHFYPLLGNPDTMTGKLIRHLGVTTDWINMDPVDQFHLPDGSRFVVPADFDQYLAQLKATFPHEAQALDTFFANVREAYMYGLLCYFRGRDTARLDRFRDLTVQQVLDQSFQNPKLKLILTADCAHWGSPPSRTSFVFDAMLRLSYFLGNYYPRGGSQAFADDLARCFEMQGGHILMRALATRILVERQTVSGVEIETRRGRQRSVVQVRAGWVVANSDLRQTLESLIQPQYLKSEYLQAARQLRPTYPCFLTHIGLRDVPTDVLHEAHGYYWDEWDTERMGHGALKFKLFVPTLYDPSLARHGGHIIVIQKVLDIDYDTIDDWGAHKVAVEDGILKHLEHLIPGITERMVVKLSASAQTSYRYTLNYQGAMLGWEMSPEQLGHQRFDVTGPLERLYFVGHWVQPGGGITPVIVSAMNVAKKIVAASATPPSLIRIKVNTRSSQACIMPTTRRPAKKE